MDYKQIVNMAYKKYVKDWCESRGYSPTDVDPTVGINGERYATINEFEKNEFQNRGRKKAKDPNFEKTVV